MNPKATQLVMTVIAMSLLNWSNTAAMADLNDILNETQENENNYLNACEIRKTEANYESEMRVSGGIVYKGRNCVTSGGFGVGIDRWEQIGILNEIKSRQCNYGGVINEQWTIRDGKLSLIWQAYNCAINPTDIDNWIKVDSSYQPIYWYCGPVRGYNPNNLKKECNSAVKH